MKEKLKVQDMIARIAEKSGSTKKASSEFLKAIPEVVLASLEMPTLN